MGQRIFVPTLIEIARRLCIYMTRYNDTLVDNITTLQLVSYEQLRAACNAFLNAMDVSEDEEG